jgi:hypothetical protein
VKLALAFLAGVLVAVGMSGRAETWGVATLGSKHLNGKDYCEFNPGLGGEWDWKYDTRIIGGFYYPNSLCEEGSLYLGGLKNLAKYQNWRGGVAAMGLTGYSSPLTLGVALALSYEGKENGFNVVWFPSKKGDFTRGVLAFQAKHKW